MLKVHFVAGTRAGRVVWLLEELGLEYEVNIMPFTKEGLKSPEHRARHALGRVPVLEDGDISIQDHREERESGGGAAEASSGPTARRCRFAAEHAAFPHHACEEDPYTLYAASTCAHATTLVVSSVRPACALRRCTARARAPCAYRRRAAESCGRRRAAPG